MAENTPTNMKCHKCGEVKWWYSRDGDKFTCIECHYYKSVKDQIMELQDDFNKKIFKILQQVEKKEW